MDDQQERDRQGRDAQEQEALYEQRTASEEVFKGTLLHVFRDTVRLPGGASSSREIIRHPGASAVLPVYPDGSVLLIRQFRYPCGKVFLEVPAGKIDPGESPAQTAARESEEEAGIRFRASRHLSSYYPAIGYSDEVIHLYVAWDLEEVPQRRDHDEFVLLDRLPFERARAMAAEGAIDDGKTALLILRAWHWWQAEGPFPLG